MPTLAGSSRTSRRSQAERRAQSERRLLAAAAELIVEQGTDAASVAEIGRRAGYSHALVNHHFGSKEGLLQRLNDDAVELFTDTTIHAVGERRGMEALIVAASTYLDLVQAPDPLGRVHLIVWSETLAHGSRHRSYRLGWDRYFRKALADVVRDGQADGTVAADLDADACGLMVAGLLRGIALQVMLDPAAATEALKEDVATHLRRMLRP